MHSTQDFKEEEEVRMRDMVVALKYIIFSPTTCD